MNEMYYLQDSRTFCGNCVFWWAKGKSGYVTDIKKAHLFTKEEAERQNECRETDIPWPTTIINELISHTIDMQYLPKTEPPKEKP